MGVRSSAASRRRGSVVGMTVFVVAFVGGNGGTIARAQGGRAPDQHPAQGTNAPGILNPYAAPPVRGSYSPYLAKDPTAGERVEVAGRVYRAVLDDWVRRAGMPPRPGGGAADVEARSLLELVERLGPWSLRWQEAQDDVAKTRAARYQSLSDHLVRMSDLEHGHFRHGNDRAKAADAPVEPRADDIPAEAARFFRPIDGWSLDQVVPTRLQSGRPLNPVGVGVTPAEQAEIAARVYRAVLDEAVGRFLASPREGEARRHEEAIFDVPLAERLGFWSDLWSQAQDAAVRDLSSRSTAARASLGGVRSGGRGPLAAIRAHIERMNDLENGRFADDARRAGRPTGRRAPRPDPAPRVHRGGPLLPDRGRGPAAGRVGATGRRCHGFWPGGDRGPDLPRVLDGAARRYREGPVRAGCPPMSGLVFDSRLAERLAAWSARWARAQIRADGSRPSSSPRSSRTSSGWRRWRTAGRFATSSSGQFSPRRDRRPCAAPRIRRRRPVLSPGGLVGTGADQGPMRATWLHHSWFETERPRTSREELLARRYRKGGHRFADSGVAKHEYRVADLYLRWSIWPVVNCCPEHPP